MTTPGSLYTIDQKHPDAPLVTKNLAYENRFACGTTCLLMLGPDHWSLALAPPARSMYSRTMLYFWPATRSMEPDHSVVDCGTSLSMMRWPLMELPALVCAKVVLRGP